MEQTSIEKETSAGNEMISAQEAEDLKMKEKRRREREVCFFPFISCRYILIGKLLIMSSQTEKFAAKETSKVTSSPRNVGG